MTDVEKNANSDYTDLACGQMVGQKNSKTSNKQ